jgi:hypothetical protein
MFIFALNEFNNELLKTITNKYQLKNLQKLSKFNLSETHSIDKPSSGFLEPWVQWTSISLGVPSRKHNTKHLGDTKKFKMPQLWEKLESVEKKSIIWGLMNGAYRTPSKNICFVPDPWSFDEKCSDSKNDSFIGLPRYLAQFYGRLKLAVLIKKIFNFLFYLFRNFSIKEFVFIFSSLKPVFKNFGLSYTYFIVMYELISYKIFMKEYKKNKPDFSLFFMNSIAHIQHHYWKGGATDKIFAGYYIVDIILGDIYKNLSKNQPIVILNSISQTKLTKSERWNLYIPKNLNKLFKKLNIPYMSIENLMTNDCHIFFNSINDKNNAKIIMNKTLVNKTKLFFFEDDPSNKKRLFMKINFSEWLEKDTTFNYENCSFKFYDYFDYIVTSTGKHSQVGHVYSKNIKFPKKFNNYHIHNHLLEYFNIN